MKQGRNVLVFFTFIFMKIVFATNNKHKLLEIQHAVGHSISIVSLKEAKISEDIPETQDTIEGNAIQKAQYIFNKYGFTCFADDTGLEVDALNNRPGVYSSRYAGPEGSSEKNIQKLLKELHGSSDRSARFRTIIAFTDGTQTFIFEGIAEGSISFTPAGNGGFGYDPVFKPVGFNQTFAEMTLAQKNTISHRAKALQKFTEFLSEYFR